MSWIWFAAAALLQLLAGVVRVRAWFHVIRHSWPEAVGVRYRDVVVAHLGGVGINAILPAHSGDAVKVVIVSRRTPERRLALIAATMVPTALVEGAFTALLLVGLLATGLVSFAALSPELPPAGTALAVAGAVALIAAAAVAFRGRLTQRVGAGLTVLRRPRMMLTQVIPWLLVGRALRLLAFAAILPAAGLPLGVGAALALMALQGATPSAGAAATAARIALLAAVLSGTGETDVPAVEVAAALAFAYGVTSAVNLAVSGATIAWLLETTSPRRVIAYVRSAFRPVERRAPAAIEPADPA